MNPRFEEHEGKLFRMLEKPVPLQLDSPMPCVVRYIQDCSPMGRYMKRKYAMVINTVAIVSRIGTDGRAYSSDKIFIEEVEVLEIIGYPVADGSHWWALYSAMNGKSFVHKDAKQCRIFTMFSERELRVSDGEGETVEYVEIDEFLNDAAKDGWQLYEEPKPEPLLADAKVGDFVEIINWCSGTKHLGHIDSIDHEIHIGTHRFDISGKSVMERVPQLSIIRKLSPSEVIVNIGCLSGTVRPVSTNGTHIWFHLIGVDDKTIATIRIGHLDSTTRKLVKSLLKAQEQNNG